MQYDVVQAENKVLRGKAAAVPVAEITSPKIQKILNTMRATLAEYRDGVALAAPQIGIPLRVFVVADSFFEGNEDDDVETKLKHRDTSTYSVYINPVITKTSSKKADMDEGCLSVRWVYGKTKRFEKVTIAAYNELGKKFTRGASGLLAQAFQHETDHLNGTLFIDHATDLEEVDPTKIVEEEKT